MPLGVGLAAGALAKTAVAGAGAITAACGVK